MLSALGEKIFVDRYALKEYNKFAINDRVLVKHLEQSIWGTVLSFKDDTVDVQLESGEQISCEKRSVEKPIETPERMFKRVAVAVAKAEENKGKWRKEFFHLLENWKFIPGGRILSAAGAGGLRNSEFGIRSSELKNKSDGVTRLAEGDACVLHRTPHSALLDGTVHDNLTFY